jgi:ABC-type transport system substrate-binding protein/tRNA A-37 threonylcarbamoyl transferase component Bud32
VADDLEGRLLSGFRLHSLIGQGAHGSVWRARQLRLDRDVAVKILDPLVARDPETVRRFEREGRTAASIDHPNVVPVYEAGEADGLAFLAMRLVEGTTLEAHVDDTGPLSPTRAAELLAPIAAALDHVHAMGLVHRDVKPSNILIDDDRMWLTDFGIAASLRELGNYTTGALGTAEYMAPEQANAADVDHRADIYGLGCVAHFVMEGAPPFAGDDLISTLMAHVNDPVPSTGDDDRDRFYERALAKNPDDRFDSAGELMAALAGDGPVTSPSTPTPAPTRRSLPRLLVGGLVISVLAALGALALLATNGTDSDTATLDPAGSQSSPTPTAPPASSEPPSPATPSPTTAPPAGDEGNAPSGDDVAGSIPPSVGGRIEVATGRRLTSLNPHADLDIEPFITANVLPPLMIVNDDWTLSPWLSDGEPEVVSVDPFVVRWRLRDDAVWDDSTPVSSTDVSRTLDYITDPGAGTIGTGLYAGVTIRIIDDKTFELSSPEPIGPYRLLFSTIHPVVKAAAYDEHLAAGNPPSTFLLDEIGFSGGPFLVSGYDPGERLTLVRNDDWWGDTARLDRITIRNFDNARRQLDAVESGDVDLAYVEIANTSDAARARGLEEVAVEVGTGVQLIRLDMNARRGASAELAVRTAIASALDRFLIAGAVVTPVTGAGAEPLESAIWPSSYPANGSPFARFDGDVNGAEQILQTAGWQLDTTQRARFKDGDVLELQLLYEVEASVLGQTLAGSIVSQLLEVGIRVVADAVPRAEIEQRRVTGDYDLVAVVDITSPDPVSALFRWGSAYCPEQFGLPGCDSKLPGNTTGIADADLDALLDAATTETDAATRDRLYGEIDERLAELVPTLPLTELPAFIAYSTALDGVQIETPRSGPFSGMARWGFGIP